MGSFSYGFDMVGNVEIFSVLFSVLIFSVLMVCVTRSIACY